MGFSMKFGPVIWFDSLGSTNVHLRRMLSEDTSLRSGMVIAARQQREGRGRGERKWVSTAGKDLTFSFFLRAEVEPASIASLALVAGLGVAEALEKVGVRGRLKWPNDVLVGGRKICGILSEHTGADSGGLAGAIVGVGGEYACGYLKSEHGVHRLVRLSPFDADHARHTSFALVEVIPEAEADVDVKIEADDLRVDVFRSSGPGGQHMQKTSSAVRLTHLPTGLVVTCQSERSQYQNKETALRILQSRLLELELAKRDEERARLKGKRIAATWGNQIRSYVLHPYKMVKDHRTNYQTSDTNAVLDGELGGFITTYLRAMIGKEG